MRKSIVIAVSLLFVVASAFAQQRATPSNTVSVFISDAVVSYSSSSGSRLDASYGGAFDHMFNRHISAEVSLTSQPARRYFSTFVTNGQPVTSSSTVHFHPIDASISYHFLTDSRWKPYLGGGLRYLNNSVILTGGPLGNQRLTTRTVDPEISGGVVFQFRPTLGLRFDAKQIVGNSGSVLGERSFTGSVGLSFRF
ncbi:MAG: outer membrane beta-barrel protein [Acidobacteria bacterium]|nr:outer membrane beta-barrel protein [Acidobacteriota bacterium]MBV9070210.1 outer membrane beta-barrel protein [Acidobacteriota bacterium]MBV9184355.1 outer membrane beta-barrel protein [Acidobacteriota bacterium]